ncbi:oligopeptide/dipeptide ABC transporter ATP-binding protein [Dongshaea marina]|uniref:oligopeptide/dipeptide ABC transporter ATP-binding protein n=1 Tax=Dongshaea marina TaxID=2047966 RepID=UPI000D3E31A3|nr:oligopeptide/dipeptide ABC transporter ATP-binding protein [Dongshaea marina]
MAMLDIRNLILDIEHQPQPIRVLDAINLTLNEGEVHAVIGNAGSGKSLITRALMGLYKPDWMLHMDRLFFDGVDLLELSLKERRQTIKQQTALIFQDPIACLDPSMTIAKQVGLQLLRYHRRKGKQKRLKKVDKQQQIAALLHRVGINQHELVMNSYPAELTRGICQKVMIAMALAREPRLLIADEPLQSLPPQTQAQILRLLAKSNQLNGTTILLFSQDLCSIAHFADRLTILYCGQIVESGPAEELLGHPRHPYTQALLNASPQSYRALPHQAELPVLKGTLPALSALPKGCRLGPRCPSAQQKCVQSPPLVQEKNRSYRCHFPLTMEPTDDPESPPAQSSGPDKKL